MRLNASLTRFNNRVHYCPVKVFQIFKSKMQLMLIEKLNYKIYTYVNMLHTVPIKAIDRYRTQQCAKPKSPNDYI